MPGAGSVLGASEVWGELHFACMEAIGPIIVLLSIPLLFRWIPRNPVYGFRVAATLADASVWYDANALVARHMIALGLLMVALELTLPVSMRIIVLRVVAVIGLAVVIVVDWRAANRLLRDRRLGRPSL